MIMLDKIQSLATNGATYRKGVTDYKRQQVFDLCLQSDEKHITAKVKDYTIFEVNIYLDKKGQDIEDYHCTCPYHVSYEGACKHVIATLLAYKDVQKEGRISQRLQLELSGQTDSTLKRLLNQYAYTQVKVPKAYNDEKREVHLIPTLQISETGQFSMTLSLQIEKIFPIKDIKGFCRALRTGEEISLSKNISVSNLLENLQGQALELGKVLTACIELDTTKESISLSGILLERILSIYRGDKISCILPSQDDEEKYAPLEIEITQEKLPCCLNIKHEEESFKVSLDEKMSGLHYYNETPYHYVLLNEKLYTLDEEEAKQIAPLLQVLFENPQKELYISKEEMPIFAQIILPKVKDCVVLDIAEEEMEKYIPEELEVKIYLDLPKKSKLTLRMTYTYGDKTWEALTNKLVEAGKKASEESIKVLRNEIEEREMEKRLEVYHLVPNKKGEWELTDEELIYDFIMEGIEQLEKCAIIYVSDKLKTIKVRQVKSVPIGVSLEGEMIEIDLSKLGLPVDELAKVLEAYRIKKRYYRLKNGDFVNLKQASFGELTNLVEGLGISEESLKKEIISLPSYRALYLEQMSKQNQELHLNRNNRFRELIRDFEEIDEADLQVPSEIKAQLRNYQISGFRWFMTLAHYGFGGILADDMGLGKTIQTIAFLAAQSLNAPALIVCPTSLVLNWQDEFAKFAPHMKVLKIDGTVAVRENKIEQIEQYEVVITSYELLKRDIAKYENKIFSYCIIDEAQYIKNSHTQNAKAVKLIQSKGRFALTGTPIENSLVELWSLFDFIMPGYLLSQSKFRNRIELPILRDKDEEAVQRLRRMIAPFIMRRLKKDVLEELPDKTETTLYAQLTGEQAKVYNAYAIQAKEEIMREIEGDNFDKSKIKILAILTRLRQICADPRLFIENYNGESSKLEMCIELIERTIAAGHKILLFSQFTTMLDRMAETFEAKGISYTMLKGNVKARERMARVNAFNEGDTSVFLISLKAGGVGLNLTSADVVIHYDPWWNIAAQNQATDRAYRIGQTNNVQVFKLITKGTVEEKIKEMQDLKQTLTEDILSSGDNLILSKEDVMALLSTACTTLE